MNKLHLLTLFITTIVFTGCGPSEKELELEKKLEALMQAEQERLDEQEKQLKLNGSVFVVTKGGTNYKLGLTPVAAITKEDFERVESIAIDAVNRFILDNSPAYRKALAEIKPLKDKLDLLSKQHDIADGNLDKLIKEKEFLGSKSGIYIYNGTRNVSYYGSDSSSQALARSIRAEINSEIAKLNAIAEQFKETKDQANDAKNRMDRIANEAKNQISTYQRSLATVALGVTQTKTKTNADGEFSLNLTRGMDFVLVAFADRSIGKSSEEYNWLIPYTTPLIQGEDTLLISNDTMASDTSPATSGLKIFKSSPYLGYIGKKTLYN